MKWRPQYLQMNSFLVLAGPRPRGLLTGANTRGGRLQTGEKLLVIGLYRRDPAFIMTLLMILASFSCEVSTCFFSLSSSSFCVADFARFAKSKRGFESSFFTVALDVELLGEWFASIASPLLISDIMGE